MVKEVKDDEIDFTDLSAIKTPEQHEAFRVAAADAREKLLALDTPESDFLRDMLDNGEEKAPEPKKTEEKTESTDKKPEPKPEEKKTEAEKKPDEPVKKDELAAAPVDDDLKALAPEAQKLVMDARAATAAAKKDADDTKAAAAEESKKLKNEFEGKQTETLKLSEVNQDRAGFAQVNTFVAEVDSAIEKKGEEVIAAQEEGDTKKALKLNRELFQLEIKKKEGSDLRQLYLNKYGTDEKGGVNFRALDTKKDDAEKTVVTEEKKPDPVKDKPKEAEKPAASKEALEQMTAWHANNKVLLDIASPEVMQSIGKLADSVAEMYGLKTETPEFYDELNRVVKIKHGIDLVGSRKPEEKKPEGKLQDIPSTVASVDRSVESKVTDSQVVVTARQRQMHQNAGKDPNDPVWLKNMAEMNKINAEKDAAQR